MIWVIYIRFEPKNFRSFSGFMVERRNARNDFFNGVKIKWNPTVVGIAAHCPKSKTQIWGLNTTTRFNPIISLNPPLHNRIDSNVSCLAYHRENLKIKTLKIFHSAFFRSTRQPLVDFLNSFWNLKFLVGRDLSQRP